MTTTFYEALPPTKSSKRPGLQWVPAENKLVITTDRSRTTYRLTRIPTDWNGWGVRLEVVFGGTDSESEDYSVFCSADGPGADTCECKGWLFKQTCKHRDAVRALIENGWL